LDTNFQQILLAEVRYIREQVDKHRDDHHELKREVERLKIHTGFIGAISGAFTAVVAKIFT
jgi:hypothetical protein